MISYFIPVIYIDYYQLLLYAIPSLAFDYEKKENYISLLMTKMLQFPPPGHVVHSFCQAHNNVHVMTTTGSNSFQLVFLTKSDWCSIFYSCFMPFPIKSNERKLMNVHVQIKCYIMLLTIKGPKLVIIYPQLNNTIINRIQKNYLRLLIILHRIRYDSLTSNYILYNQKYIF